MIEINLVRVFYNALLVINAIGLITLLDIPFTLSGEKNKNLIANNEPNRVEASPSWPYRTQEVFRSE